MRDDTPKVLSPPRKDNLNHQRGLHSALNVFDRDQQEQIRAEGDADLFARLQGAGGSVSGLSDRISYDALFGSRYDSATDEDYEVMEDIIQNPKAYRNDLKPYVVNISKAEVNDLRKQIKKTKSHFTDDDDVREGQGTRRYKLRRAGTRSIF